MKNETMKWQYLTLEQKDRIMIVCFDTGSRANTLNTQLMLELLQLARLLEDDTELAAIIITGKNNIFSGGFQLEKKAIDAEEVSFLASRNGAQLGARVCEAWERLEQMTIVAIEGWCVGGGVAIAIACDLRIVGQGATLYVPEIERGMNMSWGSVPRMVALIGPAKTKRLFVMAQKLPASQALEWGVVDEVVADGRALDKALQMANEIADLPPIPVRMCKQAINAAAHALNHSVSFMDADQNLLTAKTDDYQEAISAFLEKRDPVYQGQ